MRFSAPPSALLRVAHLGADAELLSVPAARDVLWNVGGPIPARGYARRDEHARSCRRHREIGHLFARREIDGREGERVAQQPLRAALEHHDLGRGERRAAQLADGVGVRLRHRPHRVDEGAVEVEHGRPGRAGHASYGCVNTAVNACGS